MDRMGYVAFVIGVAGDAMVATAYVLWDLPKGMLYVAFSISGIMILWALRQLSRSDTRAIFEIRASEVNLPIFDRQRLDQPYTFLAATLVGRLANTRSRAVTVSSLNTVLYRRGFLRWNKLADSAAERLFGPTHQQIDLRRDTITIPGDGYSTDISEIWTYLRFPDDLKMTNLKDDRFRVGVRIGVSGQRQQPEQTTDCLIEATVAADEGYRQRRLAAFGH